MLFLPEPLENLSFYLYLGDNLERTVKLIEYFEVLPEGMIDQSHGTYEGERKPCCFGAHVAHVLAGKEYYREGMEALCADWDCNMAQVVLMLRECGAGRNPFGGDEWETPPAEVLRRIAGRYEEPPSLQGAHLRGASLFYANLEGAQLEGADLRGAGLEGAQLQGANLKGAKLRNANLFSANLEGANLRGADLRGAILRHANLIGAILEGAQLENANLICAIVEDTKF